jgi:FkbM family methyltransferase
MTSTPKSEANGRLPRAWQFLQRPWSEKKRVVSFRWTKFFANIPTPIRLPYGAWWLARNDALAGLLLGEGFENAERYFVERFLQPEMTVLDIGAHHGFYTLLASKRVGPLGKVISFEPSPREHRALRLHLLLNRCRNVIVERLALGDEDTESDLYVVENWGSGCNSLRPPDIPAGTSKLRVRVRRLDSWLAQRGISRIDFIKLDVEGAELGVLKGAAQFLEMRPRPVILAEVQNIRTLPWGYRANQIVDHLKKMEYRWFGLSADGSVEELLDLNPNDWDGNFVACPEESLSTLQRCRRGTTSP